MPQCVHLRRIASASRPSAVSLTNEARLVCMRSEVWIHPAWIQNARRIERIFQVAMQLHQRWRQRMEHADRLVPAPEERGMAAGASRGIAYRFRIAGGLEPAQRAAPFDQ